MDEDQGLIGNAQELITGAVVLLIGYVIYKGMNGPFPKLFNDGAKTVDTGLNLVNSVLSSPLLAALLIGLVGAFRVVFGPRWRAALIRAEKDVAVAKAEVKRAEQEALAPEQLNDLKQKEQQASEALNKITDPIKNGEAFSHNPQLPQQAQAYNAAAAENPKLLLENNASARDWVNFLQLVTTNPSLKDKAPHEVDLSQMKDEDIQNSKVTQLLREAQGTPGEKAAREAVQGILDHHASNSSLGLEAARMSGGGVLDFLAANPRDATYLQYLVQAKGPTGDLARGNVSSKNSTSLTDTDVMSLKNTVDKYMQKEGFNPEEMSPELRKEIAADAAAAREAGGEKPGGKEEKPGEHTQVHDI